MYALCQRGICVAHTAAIAFVFLSIYLSKLSWRVLSKMSWKIRKHHEMLRAAEEGREGSVWARGLNVGMVYPNLYYFGMSNLGFQTLYKIFHEMQDVNCERFFLPDEAQMLEYKQSGDTLLSVDSDTPASEFDLLAFSISYQNDVLNIPALLERMKISFLAKERAESDPIILAGGPAMTINPLPVVDFIDAVVIGEGEEVALQIAEVFKTYRSRQERLEELAKLTGVFVPTIHLHEKKSIWRLRVDALEPPLAHSKILTPHTEFGDMYLVEVQRGCQWACRFCAAGYIYRYPRYSQIEMLKSRIDEGFRYRKKMGLLAGDLLGYGGLLDLLRHIDEKGGSFSPSSVRLNAFTPEIIHYLKKSGNRTIAIAPEAGSERLRRQLNKTFTDEEVVNSAVMLAEGGIVNIKLYIMVGLPDEKDEDIEALCRLTLATREALIRSCKKLGKIPRLTLSLSPFTPKPATPFEREVYEGLEPLREKFRKIKSSLMPVGNIVMSGETDLDAYVETLLSRGDERVGEFILKYHQQGRNLKRALKQLSFDPNYFITRSMLEDKILPWSFIDHGTKEGYLLKERERAAKSRIIPPCEPTSCHICGIC